MASVDGTAPGAAPGISSDSDLAPLTRRIVDLLRSGGIGHRVLRHPPVLTSEEASRVRGTPLEAGAKALVCQADDRIVLIVVPADARLDNRVFRQQAGVRNVRMIDAGRVQELVGAPVGAVPPFGSLLGLPTYADEEVVGRELIAFNAGARDVSVTMAGPDYAALERPTLGRYARRTTAAPSPFSGAERGASPQGLAQSPTSSPNPLPRGAGSTCSLSP
jgi:Ala-tRNA(Pro) deacylase